MTDAPMKNVVFLPILLAAMLITGCASYEKIPLSDDAVFSRTEHGQGLPAPVKAGLLPVELGKIEREIFNWLLTNTVDHNGKYSAVFLQTDETTTASLMKQFPGHIPPIKQLWHLEVRAGQSPLDKDTSRTAIILSAEVMDPENGTVVAVGKWFAGDAAAGFRTFEFRKNGEEWKILSVK